MFLSEVMQYNYFFRPMNNLTSCFFSVIVVLPSLFPGDSLKSLFEVHGRECLRDYFFSLSALSKYTGRA